MRLGVHIADGPGLEALVGEVRQAADAGLASAHFGQLASWDAVTAAALCAGRVPGIEIGTAIVPTYPRHPLVLAGQALTAQAASGNRFVLGIGPGHRPIVEGQFGLSFDRPARHVREYLTALRPLLHGEDVEFHGETLTVVGRVDVPGTSAPPVLLAALAPKLLRLAGELADGTITVWTGARHLEETITPAVTAAATAAGRPAPRVVAGVLAAVTDDRPGALQTLSEQLGFVAELPSYRALLDRQGLTGVHETAAVGDELEVEREIRRFAAAGATDLVVGLFGDEPTRKRTLALLSDLATQV
ncbi:LLM class F420-dependent oxidoreductase [Frankia sp. CcI49]|uniref:TIGR03564 family F420-dependent LLM class oxidoreductase n=1 Tax=Frankia sp. CcI49 TaxID=1745382 RepID=UPI00097593BB|nr:TIGR03564 family F420-dependent LLM class oxidoreductase [Frankia sp. CcI49]ONH49969.1 LLM class F420-dependent oxidoreductase [Frankia sp. CcI49]